MQSAELRSQNFLNAECRVQNEELRSRDSFAVVLKEQQQRK